jgi:hypothetical protein
MPNLLSTHHDTAQVRHGTDPELSRDVLRPLRSRRDRRRSYGDPWCGSPGPEDGVAVEGSGVWRRVADLLRAADEGERVGPAVARVAADLLGVDDVSLTIVVDGQPVSTVATSDFAAALSRRQFALGEGPTVAALLSGDPMTVDDLRSGDGRADAPVLTSEAWAQGAGAMFAFPLRMGAAVVGVMTGHRALPGPLTTVQYTDALILSALVTLALLENEAGGSLGRTDGALATVPDLEAGMHAVVQVAAGMVSEQLDVPILEALVRVRAHAFAVDEDVHVVARRIVEREFRMER